MFNILKTIFKPKKRQVSEKRHVPVQPTVRKQPSVVVKVQEKVQEEAQLALTRANEEVAKKN